MLHALCIGLAATGVVGCVDHDYDLSEDIDVTIQLGGDNLTLPGSSTDQLFLSKILDLEQGSSIKAVENDGEYGLAKGDYVLIQDGNSSPSRFEVPEVSLGHINGSTSTSVLPEFYNPDGQSVISNPTDMIHNTIRLSDDNVTRDLVSLESADMDVKMKLNVRYTSSDFTGTAYVEKGYTITFDKCWTVEVGDEATAQYLESVNPYTLRFKQRYGISPDHGLSARVRLVRADLTGLPAGQGLYAPGKFLIENQVVSSGDVSIDVADLPAGSRANITVVSEISVSDARLLKVRGIVDPKINISETKFDINDIPDFLSDPENHLDLSNPQVTLSITNNSPLPITLNGRLTSYSKGNEIAEVGIGESYGTAPVIAHANGTTDIIISRAPVAGAADNIVVPELSTLLNTIPDLISFHDAVSKAVPQVSEFILGSTYTFDCDYTAVIPLAFGDAMQLHYTHIDDNWTEDLEKYNFNTAVVTADVVNTIPLDMTPDAVALDAHGNDYTTIDVDVDGTVSAGTIAQPSVTQLKITLKSTGKNISGLDGVKLLFYATANDSFTGTNLNKDQAVKFENIKITLKGGVLVDLNN